MSGFVDVNAWSGTWPFGSGETFALADVIVDLQRVGVATAWVSPLGAVLAAHPAMANAALVAEANALRPDDFDLGVAPIIDPSLADWPNQLAAAESAGDRLRAIRIVPNYHDYALDQSAVDGLAAMLIERNIPLIVQVRMLDERAHHPRVVVPPVPVDEIAALGRRHPALRFIASGIFFGELAVIADAPNIAVELSSIETGETLPDVLAVIPPERIMLGTHAPLYVPDAARAKLGGDGADSDTITTISAGNAQRFVQLSPSMEGNRS